MAVNTSVFVGLQSVHIPQPRVEIGPLEGFVQKGKSDASFLKKGRFAWTTRFFRLCFREVQGIQRLCLGYNKVEVDESIDTPNYYWLNVTDGSKKGSVENGPDNDLTLILSNVVQVSHRYTTENFVNVKLMFSCKFDKKLWKTCIQEALKACTFQSKVGSVLNCGSALPASDTCTISKAEARSKAESPGKFRASKHEAKTERHDELNTQRKEKLSLEVDCMALVDMSSSRSLNSRIFCQRLANFGFNTARYSFKYEPDEMKDMIVGKGNQPHFLGLKDMVEKLYRQPFMFGLTVGILGHLSALISAIADSCNNDKGPLGDDVDKWREIQGNLIKDVDSLLQEAVQKANTVAKYGSISLMLLELTNTRMSLVSIPSGQKAEIITNCASVLFSTLKSIACMRLDPNVLSGLGAIAKSSLDLMKKSWAQDFCNKLRSISALPDFFQFEPLINRENKDKFSELLNKLHDEVAHRYHHHLFVHLKKGGKKPIRRWEFHSAFAVILSKLVLRMKHENLRLIKHLRSAKSVHIYLKLQQKQQNLVDEYLRIVDGDRFVLELLLEKLDSYHPFQDAEDFQRYLRETDGQLAEIVQPFLKNEFNWICIFHQKQQQAVAAARQIEEQTQDYQPSFMSRFEGFDMDEDAQVIAESNSLISDFIFGFRFQVIGDDKISGKGEKVYERVTGLIDLACFGLDTSDSEADSYHSYKLSQWASSLFLSASNKDSKDAMFKDGLDLLKNFISDMVVASAAKFEIGKIERDEPQIIAFELDRRLESLMRTGEQLNKAINYIKRFDDLVKIITDFAEVKVTSSDPVEGSQPDGSKTDSDSPEADSELTKQLKVLMAKNDKLPGKDFLLHFFHTMLPAALKLLLDFIRNQIGELKLIKQEKNFEARKKKLDTFLQDKIAVYSVAVFEFQSLLEDVMNGLAKLACNFSNVFEVPQGLSSVVDTIKDVALDELKKIADNYVEAGIKEVAGQIGEVLSNIGIKSIFSSLGNLLSDYNSKKQAEQEPFRVREVAVFCIAFIAEATGSVELLKFLAKRRILEVDVSVQAVLKATDASDPSYKADVFEHLLKFWCPVDAADNCLHMFCLSGGRNALQIPPQEIFFENDYEIQQCISKKFEVAEKLRDDLEKQTDLVAKQLLMVRLRKLQKEIKQLASNVSDVGAKLNIVIDYLCDMQDQLGRMDAKLSIIQSGIDDLRKDMFTLTGKPLMDIIEQCANEHIVILNRQLAEEVYVPSISVQQKYSVPKQGSPKWDVETSDKASVVETAFSCFMQDLEKNSFLLAGKAGSGKSTTLNRLKYYILTDYANLRKQQGWTVVLLCASLPSLKNPKSDLFREAAMQTFGAEFRDLHVDLLRERCRNGQVDENGNAIDGVGVEIVFFFDAWDELRPEFQSNLWVSNNLERFVVTAHQLSKVFSCQSHHSTGTVPRMGHQSNSCDSPKFSSRAAKKQSSNFLRTQS
jgi:hypothetical protein